ncbi:MAG: hypothetical protein J6J16_09390 [Lachnospiraceae bacterium]|nr:hypothetical protein [Lachnospiraceae bacterium]
MSEKEKDLIEEVEDDVETDERGYQKHKFSLFDSAIEILLVIFIVAFVGYRVFDFFFLYPDGTDMETIVRYIFALLVDVLPAVCLIAILELHEKIDKMSFNNELTAEYMARYQSDLLERIDDIEDILIEDIDDDDDEEEEKVTE